MRDLGKLIVAKGFKQLPQVQLIAQFGHTDPDKLELEGVFRYIRSVLKLNSTPPTNESFVTLFGTEY